MKHVKHSFNIRTSIECDKETCYFEKPYVHCVAILWGARLACIPRSCRVRTVNKTKKLRMFASLCLKYDKETAILCILLRRKPH